MVSSGVQQCSVEKQKSVAAAAALADADCRERGREFISIENVSQRESEIHGMQTQIAKIKTGSDRLITERKKASVLKKAGIAAERMKYMRSTGSTSSVQRVAR